GRRAAHGGKDRRDAVRRAPEDARRVRHRGVAARASGRDRGGPGARRPRGRAEPLGPPLARSDEADARHPHPRGDPYFPVTKAWTRFQASAEASANSAYLRSKKLCGAPSYTFWSCLTFALRHAWSKASTSAGGMPSSAPPKIENNGALLGGTRSARFGA